jgi:hypothetical protein
MTGGDEVPPGVWIFHADWPWYSATSSTFTRALSAVLAAACLEQVTRYLRVVPAGVLPSRSSEIC